VGVAIGGPVPPVRSRGKAPDFVTQKLMIFCQLYYNEVLGKKSKQYLSNYKKPALTRVQRPKPVMFL